MEWLGQYLFGDAEFGPATSAFAQVAEENRTGTRHTVQEAQAAADPGWVQAQPAPSNSGTSTALIVGGAGLALLLLFR